MFGKIKKTLPAHVAALSSVVVVAFERWRTFLRRQRRRGERGGDEDGDDDAGENDAGDCDGDGEDGEDGDFDDGMM